MNVYIMEVHLVRKMYILQTSLIEAQFVHHSGAMNYVLQYSVASGINLLLLCANNGGAA